MNVLDKIEKLRLDRGWSVYRLAEKAGITDKCIYPKQEAVNKKPRAEDKSR